MKLSALQKLGGVSIILGSVLLTAYSVFFYLLLPVSKMKVDPVAAIAHPDWRWIAAVAFAGLILMIFGFIAVYSRIHEGAGMTGLIGFVFIELAYLMQLCNVASEIIFYPIIAWNAASAFLFRDMVIHQDKAYSLFESSATLAILIGIIFFCLALVKSREFKKLAGILVFSGALTYGLGPMLSVGVGIAGIVVFSIGCFMIGIRLMKEKTA